MKKCIIIQKPKMYMMATEMYSKSKEFQILFKDCPLIEGVYKKGKPEGMESLIEGVFTTTEGKEFIVYIDWSANPIEMTDAKGYPQ